MDCYTVNIYVSRTSEGEQDAVVELTSPKNSSVVCYHIDQEGALIQAPDVRLSTAMEKAARGVLCDVLQLATPSNEWWASSSAREQRNRAA